ncbi:MAG: PAS domain-containing sensor histidine kinase [Pseudomonadota bacterium]
MEKEKQSKKYMPIEMLAGIGHWSLNLVSNVLYWSEQVYRIHGLSPDTYTPTLESAIEFYHPEDKAHVSAYVSMAIEHGKSYDFSLRILRQNGEVRYVNSRAECEKNQQGKVVRVFGVFQDVTEKIHERADFERTRLAHQSLIESTNDGYWDWLIQEDYEYMSPRFWEMFGYQSHEKSHKPSAWQDMIFEEDLKIALCNFTKHVETLGEYPYRQEARYRHKDGSTITVLCRGRVVEWDEQQRPIRMVGTHTDVTALKRVESDLRQANEFYRLLINANTDLIFVKDAHSRIIDANNAFLDLYPGKTLADIVGTTTAEEFIPEDAAAFLAQDQLALASGESEIIETVENTEGVVRTLLTKKIRFLNNESQPNLLCVCRDITQLQDTEVALKLANEELKEFAYRTSHDLRSPLVSSRRLVNIIMQKLAKDELSDVPHYLKLIDSSLGELEILVMDILKMTQLEHASSCTDKIDFPKLVESLLQKLSNMEGFSRINFYTDFEKLSKPIEAPLTHMKHVVENLLSNAIKYQDYEHDNPSVTISAQEEAYGIVFSVSDNGIGIPEKHREYVFSMFKRFHPKTAFGSGLGLYMVKKCVEGSFGGSIFYKPLTKGSKFTIKMPKYKKEHNHE